jgi:hypothetical protein
MLEEQAKELGGNSNPLLLCFVLDIFRERSNDFFLLCLNFIVE